MSASNLDALHIDQGATTLVQSTAASGSTTIPLLSSGNRPKFVLVSQTSATPNQYAVGGAAVDATGAVGVFPLAQGDHLILNVSGMTHFAWNILASNTVYVVPLTNGGGMAATSPSAV